MKHFFLHSVFKCLGFVTRSNRGGPLHFYLMSLRTQRITPLDRFGKLFLTLAHYPVRLSGGRLIQLRRLFARARARIRSLAGSVGELVR